MSRRMWWLGITAVVGMTNAGAAQAPAQNLSPATLKEIVTGVQSCIAATTSRQVDQAKLKADGWQPASWSDHERPVDTPLTFLGKGSLLLTFDKAARPICFITARLPATATFDDVAYAVDEGLGVHGAAKPNETGTVYWFPQDHIVQLTSTGTPETRSVRAAVGYRG